MRRRAGAHSASAHTTQARDVDAALERIATLCGPERIFWDAPSEEDQRARQLRHQARWRGLGAAQRGDDGERAAGLTSGQ